jgi:uncharacterized membrane protein
MLLFLYLIVGFFANLITIVLYEGKIDGGHILLSLVFAIVFPIVVLIHVICGLGDFLIHSKIIDKLNKFLNTTFWEKKK